MPGLMPPPLSPLQPTEDSLHGVTIIDHFRWLEDQYSPETRNWIEEQTRYARSYLDVIPGRKRIRRRVQELLDIETYDSFVKSGSRYFFRKRMRGQQQSSIYFRQGAHGEDHLLIDPSDMPHGSYTAVRPFRASPDGSLLLYQIRQGGERMGTFRIFDVANRRELDDSFPRGYLHGFAFAPDGKSFYYVHDSADARRPCYRAAYQHLLGTSFDKDLQIFFAGEGERLRLAMVSSYQTIGFLVYRFLDKTQTDFYIWHMGASGQAIPILREAEHCFIPHLLRGRILACIDSPNWRIVDVQARKQLNPLYFDVIPEIDVPIRDWLVTANYILVLYVRNSRSQILIFDLFGKRIAEFPCSADESVRLVCGNHEDDEVLLERESFARPIEILRCSIPSCEISVWAKRAVPFDSADVGHLKVDIPSKDTTHIPMFLVGLPDAIEGRARAVVMTSYGGHGISVMPQFSTFVAFLMEQGCLFALPGIRGGSEFGTPWHEAGRRRNRQVAFDDFLCAAEWLIRNGKTTPANLAIFGGSNSGLLVGAAMTQRPDLFRAVLCMVPMLDMLRYHLFDTAYAWVPEFGSADNPDDFTALLRYSPYHAVREKTAYPATLIVSGDADQNCNPMHARKMTAALQAANTSNNPVLLDYNVHRGHSPNLPLDVRIDALTDRIAFFGMALGLPCVTEVR
jgi:prolyl oligopeptidase